MKNIYILFSVLLTISIKCFKQRVFKKFSVLNMRWTFGGEMGSMNDLGAVGPEGIITSS
jgi:hypothetical protein